MMLRLSVLILTAFAATADNCTSIQGQVACDNTKGCKYYGGKEGCVTVGGPRDPEARGNKGSAFEDTEGENDSGVPAAVSKYLNLYTIGAGSVLLLVVVALGLWWFGFWPFRGNGGENGGNEGTKDDGTGNQSQSPHEGSDNNNE